MTATSPNVPPSTNLDLKPLTQRLKAGGAVNRDEAIYLLKDAPLATLGAMANTIKLRHNPIDRITYVTDSNPNYTNVCDADCTFCAFYRHDDAEDAYTLTVDEVLDRHVNLAR